MPQEHSIFISYRKVDGNELAFWIYRNFSGRSVNINSDILMLTAQMDIAIPGASDWKTYLSLELERAKSLIIVCSPAAMYKYRDKYDYFYHEIEWWIDNRKNYPPILVAQKGHGHEYVPYQVLDTWGNLQIQEIDSFPTEDVESRNAKKNIDVFIENIVIGIVNASTGPDHSIVEKSIANIDGVFVWEKDRYGRYMYANDLYAMAAGYDSPKAMYGKTDYDMPWRSLANTFREGDHKIMTGDERSRIAVFEKEIMVDRIADILVSEGVIRASSKRIIGVRGCFIDVTMGLSKLLKNKFKMDDTGLSLGPEFGNEHLNATEIEIFRGLIKLIPQRKIAQKTNKTIAEVKSNIASLRKKMQCTNDEDILTTAIRAGFPLELFISGL